MKKKILILYGPLLHYRVSLFNELCKTYNVTVIASSYHGGKSVLDFNLIIKKPFKLFRFFFQSGIRSEILNGSYEVCIIFIDIAWLSYLSQIYLPRKCKVIVWGAWLTQSRIANYLRLLSIKVADSSIFYSDTYMQNFIELGANKNKMFVAHNTIKVNCTTPSYSHKIKDVILFVGSFHYRKRIDLLICIFYDILSKIPKNIKLILIGSGPELFNLELLVKKYDLFSRIEFIGSVNDDSVLQNFYNRAIVSVSLRQAGLSVLQSMGFGVPFMTTYGAISGGEIYNIMPNVNGIICDFQKDIIAKELVKLCNNTDYASRLGYNAFEHYNKYCTIENYARGFADAIDNQRNALVWKS